MSNFASIIDWEIYTECKILEIVSKHMFNYMLLNNILLFFNETTLQIIVLLRAINAINMFLLMITVRRCTAGHVMTLRVVTLTMRLTQSSEISRGTG